MSKLLNKDFPRLLKLLREERGLKQKEAADGMGVAQALLSHYENGKRECGLEFLIRASDFYGVSIDYLLGRTSSRTGLIISEDELPESSISENFDGNPKGVPVLLRKKLITNSLEIVFSLLMKSGNNELSKTVSSYLITAAYRAYRMLYSAGGKNDEKTFAIRAEETAHLCAAQMALDEIRARSVSDSTEDEQINNTRIERDYPKQSAALFSVIMNAEKELEKLK